MDIAELESAWQGLDERLAQLESQARQARVHVVFGQVRARLRLLSVGQFVQLGIAVAIVVAAGPYWIRHLAQPHLAVYGITIHLYGLVLLLVAVTQLMAVWRVDYRQPVLVVQKRLLQLAWLRVRSERGLLAAAMVAWVPLLFAGLAAVGVDVWIADSRIVIANVAIGVAMAIGVRRLAIRYADRFACDATGRSLRAAEREIAELSDGG